LEFAFNSSFNLFVASSFLVWKCLFDKHHIFTVPIVHEEFQGIRITPNVYTTLRELDRFCEQMELIARKGLPT